MGIMDRIKYGAHENIPLVYHGVGGLVTIVRCKQDYIETLQMIKLNDSRKLLGKMGVLEDHKQWVLAVVSGCVDCVASLVQAGLNHRTGIKALIQQYEHAADKLYQPRGYSKDDIMRSIVLLQLGGAHVAEFAHCSLSLPSLTTIRCNTVLHALVVLPSIPTTAEIEANLQLCYAAWVSICESHSGLGLGLGEGTQTVIHEVIMLDELAVTVF
jgi:hypothetical protein